MDLIDRDGEKSTWQSSTGRRKNLFSWQGLNQLTLDFWFAIAIPIFPLCKSIILGLVIDLPWLHAA